MPTKTEKKAKTIIVGEDVNFYGLHKWYKHAFKHLGWMILAHNHGMNDKIEQYMKNIEHLKVQLELKLKEVKDVDKKRDIKIMLDDLIILIKHCKKDFM